MNIVDRLHSKNQASELGDNICAEAADEIERLRLLLSLARDLLALYRAEHSGEYVGGTSYAELSRRIDAALTGTR